MDAYRGSLWILGALGAVLMIGAVRSKMEILLNFLLRGILGMLLIYFVNFFLEEKMPQISVGYNLLSFAVCGFLGVPGLLLLFGIQLYMTLV